MSAAASGLVCSLAFLALTLFLALVVQSRRLAARERRATQDSAALSEAEASLALFRAAVDEAPSAVLVLDEEGVVRYASQAARRVFLRGHEPRGATVADVVRFAPAPLRESLGEDRATALVLEHDGEREIFQVSRRVCTTSDGASATVLAAHPLTDQLLGEELAAYKRIIRVLSHELNNSLAPVASLTATGRRLLDAGQTGELGRVLDTVGERVEHLRTFLEQYAALARLPAPRKADVPIERVLERVATLFPGVVHEGRGVVPCDEPQLAQVLINLVKNALEAGSELADVQVVADVRAEGGLRLVVADRGRGLSDEEAASALVPFFSTKPGGSGLGLAICREIVEGHGGRLRIGRREGGGCEVVLRLPGRATEGQAALTWTLTEHDRGHTRRVGEPDVRRS